MPSLLLHDCSFVCVCCTLCSANRYLRFRRTSTTSSSNISSSSSSSISTKGQQQHKGAAAAQRGAHHKGVAAQRDRGQRKGTYPGLAAAPPSRGLAAAPPRAVPRAAAGAIPRVVPSRARCVLSVDCGPDRGFVMCSLLAENLDTAVLIEL